MNRADDCLRMTRNGPALTLSPCAPSGQRRYAVATPIQVGPNTAALIVGREAVSGRALDFADGCEAILFDRLDRIDPAGALVLSANTEETNPHNGERVLMIKFPFAGAFVPLGARRQDGTPHPHAGTGFLVTVTHGIPMRILDGEGGFDGRWVMAPDLFRELELLQVSFDGARMAVTCRERMGFRDLMPGVTIFNRGLSFVADGDDLLLPMQGAPGADDRQWATTVGCGCLRWRRDSEGWRPVEFSPATGEINGFEPTIVRDQDGSLLMTARQTGADVPEKFSVFVWRSTDGGRTWTKTLERRRTRADSPVTLNVAPDGTPFIAANLLTPNLTPRGGFGYWRDVLALWPLSKDRTKLEKPAIVRCASFEWGPAASDFGWNVDHPIGARLRLADGRWHSVLCSRGMDRGETGAGLPPTPHTGTYVDEVFSSGQQAPGPWLF